MYLNCDNIPSAAGVLSSGAFQAQFVAVEPNPAAEGMEAGWKEVA